MGDPLGLKAYLAMGKLVALLLAIGLICYQSSQIHKWHKQADAQSAARQRDRDSYEAAQKQAEVKKALCDLPEVAISYEAHGSRVLLPNGH